MKSKTSLFNKIILSAYNFYWATQQQADAARQRSEHILAVLAKYEAQPGQQILDVACGNGFYTLALAQAGFQTVGIDFMPILLETARTKAVSLKLPAEFEKMNLDNELWFDRAEFDHALCLLALHQLGNPAATLAEIRRVIQPGGLLIVTLWVDLAHYLAEFAAPTETESADQPGAKARVKNLGEQAFKKAYNLGAKRKPPRLWSEADLQSLLEKQGFEVLEIGGQPLMTAVARCK